MYPNVHIASLVTLVLLRATEAVPQDQGSGPTISPTVDSMTMIGSGCPLGSGGIVREIRNNTPVFLFNDWGLNLAEAEAGTDAVSKFCSEAIALGNGPQGYQVRIATVSVAGWAEIDAGTRLVVDVETKLAGVHASVRYPFRVALVFALSPLTDELQSKNSTLASDNLVSNTFSSDIINDPDVWSPCVNDTGKVPLIEIKTTVSLIGARLDGGLLSSGVVGGPKTDLKKALSLHFEPAWRQC